MSIVHSLKNKTKASARKAIVSMFPRVGNPWPAPKGPSVMDPGIVRSDTHILDLNLQLSLAETSLLTIEVFLGNQAIASGSLLKKHCQRR